MTPKKAWNGAGSSSSSMPARGGHRRGHGSMAEDRPEEQQPDARKCGEHRRWPRALRHQVVEHRREVDAVQAGDEQRHGEQRRRPPAPGEPAVQAARAAGPRGNRPRPGRGGRPRSARVAGAPISRNSGVTMDSTMCWTMCRLNMLHAVACSPLRGHVEQRGAAGQPGDGPPPARARHAAAAATGPGRTRPPAARPATRRARRLRGPGPGPAPRSAAAPGGACPPCRPCRRGPPVVPPSSPAVPYSR